MKHKIIISSVNGRITSICASGDTEIFLIEERPNQKSIAKLEPDILFENGKAHELFNGEHAEFLKHYKA